MKLYILILSTIILNLSIEAKIQDNENKPANFIFIFADDMAFETISANGLTDIDTPNLDRLLKKSTRFNRAYNMGA